MPERSRVLTPTADPRVFVAPDGSRHSPPAGWVCIPPGDAGLTRRLKAAGPSWAVVERRGRKVFSQGLWAPAETVARVQAELATERSTEAYAKKRTAEVARRARAEATYAAQFEAEVVAFLAFSPKWAELGHAMARKVAAHATPVGSGTVARTKRIAVSQRAEAAVLAWMRHQTTTYDTMTIARVAGWRREVRRELARVSRLVLGTHRDDVPHEVRGCPLCTAIVAGVAAEGPAPGHSLDFLL
jgi:hypothetical protein